VTSFRLRLALLVALTTVALLTGGGVAAWTLATRFNVDRLDEELGRLAAGNLARVEDAGHWARLDESLQFLAGRDRPPTHVLHVSNHGREVYRSARWPAGIRPEQTRAAETYDGVALSHPPPPPRRTGISRSNPALPQRDPHFATIETDGENWRVAVTGNPYTTLILATNLEHLNHDLARLRQRFLLLMPGVLLVVGGAAWWLASRALRPVAALTAAAENITAAGLDRRLSAPVQDREFQRLVCVFNAMLDRLEQGFHQARRFSADASHELKTPLALLQAEIEQALRAAPAGSPAQQTFTSLLEEIQHLAAILEKLLLLSLADSGRLALARSTVDLNRIVTDVLEDCAALAPDLGLQCVLEPGIQVQADATLLEQALQNLSTNAIKYNRPEGCIRVTMTATATTAVIVFGNSGPAIPAADQARLFERFFRGDPARGRSRLAGTGLGLSLSREILRAHGGDLRLLRSAEDWTEFEATLPSGPPTLRRADPLPERRL
jgi:signal transduction histidine kinase